MNQTQLLKPQTSSQKKSLVTPLVSLKASQSRFAIPTDRPRSPSTEIRFYKNKRAKMEEEIDQAARSRSRSKGARTQDIEISKKNSGFKLGKRSQQSDQQEERLAIQSRQPADSEFKDNVSQSSMRSISRFVGGLTKRNNENPGFEEEKEEEKLGNDQPESNNRLQADQSPEVPESNDISFTNRDALIAYLDKKTTGPNIEKQFFLKKQCMLCGEKVGRRFRHHVKNHIMEKGNIKSDYVFCLQAGSLQVKCKNCSLTFDKVAVVKLQEHSKACNSGESNLNNEPLSSVVSHEYKKLKEELTGEIKTLKDQVTTLETRLEKTEKKVSGVFKTQGTMKKKLDATENRVVGLEVKVEAVNKIIEMHKNTLEILLTELKNEIKSNKEIKIICDSFNSTKKEEERDRERSRERVRRGSQERMNTRQKSRDQRHFTKDRERYEERKTTRREDSSRERSPNTKEPRHYNNRRQDYQDRRSNRRY